MASWFDIITFLLTAAAFGGTIYAVVALMHRISAGVESTKEALKDRGLHVSKAGVSVKTSKRFDRDDYVDATQRGFIKAMGASSFGSANSSPTAPPAAPALTRTDSGASAHSDKARKRDIFKRSHSAAKA